MIKKAAPSLLAKILFSIPVFMLGIGLGILSQQVSTVKACTTEVITTVMHPSEIVYPNSQNKSQPTSHFHIEHAGYSLDYDARTHNPIWVCEHLTNQTITGQGNRKHSKFKEDHLIPAIFRATLDDYARQGFDRGHLAPAANHKSNQQEMDDTFYLTNMCPQVAALNRGYWANLEKYVRDLTNHYAKITVISGPLYLSHLESDGKRYVSYQVIGPHEVAVPTHFYKVLRLQTFNGQPEEVAYLVPNESIAANTPLDSFRVSLDKVQKAAGIIFFP